MATGNDIVRIARPHAERNEPYRLGVLVPKDNPNWRGDWDCAEFASYCVYQVSKKLYGCRGEHPAIADAFTGFWNDDSLSLGKRIPVNEAARYAGSFVLRVGAKMGHIVISDGKGGTIEAASESLGVINSTLSQRRWDVGILVPWIEYEETDTPPPKPLDVQVWRLRAPYMVGEQVFIIQTALRDAGFYDGKIDGVFGPITYTSVIHFQEANRLIVDGEVGKQTIKTLGINI